MSGSENPAESFVTLDEAIVLTTLVNRVFGALIGELLDREAKALYAVFDRILRALWLEYETVIKPQYLQAIVDDPGTEGIWMRLILRFLEDVRAISEIKDEQIGPNGENGSDSDDSGSNGSEGSGSSGVDT